MAVVEARNHCEIFTNKSGDQILNLFSNGPRILSNERPCQLFVTIPRSIPSHEEKVHEIFIFPSHCTTDGASLHSIGNELLSLLGGHSPLLPSIPRSEEELQRLFEEEWEKRWGRNQGAVFMPGGFSPIPSAAEGRMGGIGGRMKEAADRVVSFNNSEKTVVRIPTCSINQRRLIRPDPHYFFGWDLSFHYLAFWLGRARIPTHQALLPRASLKGQDTRRPATSHSFHLSPMQISRRLSDEYHFCPHGVRLASTRCFSCGSS